MVSKTNYKEFWKSVEKGIGNLILVWVIENIVRLIYIQISDRNKFVH